MNCGISIRSLLIITLPALTWAAVSFGNIPTADAILGGLPGQQFCITLQSSRQGSSCTFNRDCSGNNVCHEARCVPPDRARHQAWPDSRSTPPADGGTQRAQQTADPILDDGGADVACGVDRRCRIERIAARNRFRRHYAIARNEQIVFSEVNRALEQEHHELIRNERPWSVAFQRHQMGLGFFGGRTFAGHFRVEATLVFQDRRIYFVPDDPTAPTLDSFQSATFGTAHFTYLPSRSWFSPLLSVGFGMGRGQFGTSYFGNSESDPAVRYHLVTGAIGAEAQLEMGVMIRLAYRHGYLLYNQARYGPGNYDDGIRKGLNEYMNADGLNGVDFSIGWAF